MAAPLSCLIPSLLFQNRDKFLDLHSDSGLQITCRLMSSLTHDTTKPLPDGTFSSQDAPSCARRDNAKLSRAALRRRLELIVRT